MSEIGYPGRLLKVYLRGALIAAVRTKSVSRTANPIDETDGEDNGFRFIRGADLLAQQVSVAGVATSENYGVLLEEFEGNTLAEFVIEHAITGYTEAPTDGAFLTSLEYHGEHNGHVAFSATFVWSGSVTVTYTPPPEPPPVDPAVFLTKNANDSNTEIVDLYEADFAGISNMGAYVDPTQDPAAFFNTWDALTGKYYQEWEILEFPEEADLDRYFAIGTSEAFFNLGAYSMSYSHTSGASIQWYTFSTITRWRFTRNISGNVTNYTDSQDPPVAGDRIGFAADYDTGFFWAHRNGVWFDVLSPIAGVAEGGDPNAGGVGCAIYPSGLTNNMIPIGCWTDSNGPIRVKLVIPQYLPDGFTSYA